MGRAGGAILSGMALVILAVLGLYGLYIGFSDYFASGGNILAPVTATVASAGFSTATSEALETIIAPLQFSLPTATPPRECLDFRVTVIKARIRSCPASSCDTLEQVPQNAMMCVYAPVQQATDWYEINIDPQEPLTRIGFMHESVIEAINPTPRFTRTPIPSATEEPTRTMRPSRTPTETVVPPTATLTPLPSPTLPLPSPIPPSRTPLPSNAIV